jgi:hypothetical protein
MIVQPYVVQQCLERQGFRGVNVTRRGREYAVYYQSRPDGWYQGVRDSGLVIVEDIESQYAPCLMVRLSSCFEGAS